MPTDTERLDFILKYFEIDDIGDAEAVPGVVINSEKLEDDLTYGAEEPHPTYTAYRSSLIKEYEDDLRDVIDRAIKSHN